MIHKRLTSYFAVFFMATVLLLQLSCTSKPHAPADLSKVTFIPQPVSVTATGSSFELTNGMSIYVQGDSDQAKQTAQFLAEKINPATGFGIAVKTTDKTPKSGNIYLTLSANDPELGEEGYNLTITEDLVTLAANQPAGLFRGVQTIRQMLPESFESAERQDGTGHGTVILATGTIRDYPSYSFRGSMLDVSRHFFSVDDVKRYIDLIASYKMNVMHLHLSDDQGWRIEIKSWPELTKIGGSTQVGGGKGGFYTQEQYSDIVKYAQERFVTIIPEIDMPGHTNAALASYAELNCDGKARELYTGTEVGFSTFCTNKEITYKFIDDVVRELAALTPGPYIHIGGDESHATKKEDYIPFVNRVRDIVLSHGKKMIGWDETAQANLDANSTVQLWASADFAKMAVGKGAKIIMSPATKVYLDMQYDSTTKLGLHWAAYIEVDSGYIWDPATLVPGISKENIVGVEAPLWSETITNMDEIEYMVFPRLPGIAEIAWSPSEGRNWEEYKVRLGKHGARMAAMGIDFYRSPKVLWGGGE